MRVVLIESMLISSDSVIDEISNLSSNWLTLLDRSRKAVQFQKINPLIIILHIQLLFSIEGLCWDRERNKSLSYVTFEMGFLAILNTLSKVGVFDKEAKPCCCTFVPTTCLFKHILKILLYS